MEKIIEQINYFLPSFGNRPKKLVGREEIISHFLEGLELAPGSKERVTLFLGQRGYRKTVILLELAELAKQNGFIIASPTVVSNDIQDIIIEKIQEEGEKLLKSPRSKLVGGNIGFLGFSAGRFSLNARKKRQKASAISSPNYARLLMNMIREY